MAGPYDYSLGNIPDPSQSFLQGLQTGNGIQQLQVQQQQQQAAIAQQQQQAKVINALISKPNPTADDYARATLVVPGLREHFKQSWDMHNTEQQQSSLAEIGQVHAALTAGQPQYAVDLLRNRSTALKNSGGPPEQIQAAENMASVIEQNPAFARSITGMKLASIPGGDKVLANLGALGQEDRAAAKAPAELRTANAEATTKEAAAAVAPQVNAAELMKKEADARTATVTAKYADSTALADLELKGWNVKNIQSEIGYRKESNRIAAMNAAANREGNELKRQELRLKITETQQKMDDQVRTKVADAEAASNTIDNMLNTIERVKKSKGLRDVVGSIEGQPYYPTQIAAAANALNPLTSGGDDRADAIALIETLGSQAFLAQVPTLKGTGSLSNAEGEKLQTALQSLRRTQSEEQFRANLDEAARLLNKGRENVAKRYGMPLGKPDTPASPGARPPLDSFFK